MRSIPSSEQGDAAWLPDDFETEAEALKEERFRAKSMLRAIPTKGFTDWVNGGDRLWMQRQYEAAGNRRCRTIDEVAAKVLIEKLEAGIASGRPPSTLASFIHMRTVREGVFGALHSALADYADDELRTFTITNVRWVVAAADLDGVTAAQIKNQLSTHLERAGALQTPGFFIAFIHGEFEPTSGTYVLHFHGVTTAEKARALDGLRGRWGYEPTPTGAKAIVCKGINNREVQLSYLLKAYWPQRTVRMVEGKPKRDREPKRISERFHTQYLLWLDRQRLADMTVFTGGWSRRSGGPAAMRALYLSVFGR